MKTIHPDFEDLLSVFEDGSEERQYFFDAEAGRIEMLLSGMLSGEDDSELRDRMESAYNIRYFLIPGQGSHEEYRDMTAFARALKMRTCRRNSR